MAKGNGTKASQGQLELETTPEQDSPPEPQKDPTHDITELGNGPEGCWKKLASGRKVKISPEDWQQELTRLFVRAPAP